MAKITVRALSVTTIDDCVDVRVQLRCGRKSVTGNVSLEPCRDGRPGYAAMGDSLECWMSKPLRDAVKAHTANGTEWTEVLDEVEAVASAKAVQS